MSRIKLDHLSAIKVTGNDAESFLQAQLTADLSGLKEGESSFAAFCKPNGNVIAVFLLSRSTDGYLLIASKELISEAVKELSRFILRADVVFGQTDLSVTGCSDSQQESPACSAGPESSELGYCVDDSNEASADPADLAQWRSEELLSGLTWLGMKTTNQFIPQMLGLERLNAVSFKKGCFPGQEVVARVKYLGKLKRRPVIAQFTEVDSLQAGMKVVLVADDGSEQAAVVADFSTVENVTTCFLVARAAEGSVFNGFSLDEQQVRFLNDAQA